MLNTIVLDPEIGQHPVDLFQFYFTSQRHGPTKFVLHTPIIGKQMCFFDYIWIL
jgi:hypothetical protein